MPRRNIRGLSDRQRRGRMEKNSTRNITPQIPLKKDNSLDFTHIDEYIELVKQNLKNILFTVPGERVMDPDFGVGLRTFIFEQLNEVTMDEIRSRIVSQINRYASYVDIARLEVTEDSENQNRILVLLQIFVPSIQEEATLLFNDKGELSEYNSI